MMVGHVPKMWITDHYSARQNHGERQQTCLAHLVGETEFALEHGADDAPLRLKPWFGSVLDRADCIAALAASAAVRKKARA